jgi:hypothetical protein
MQSTYTGKPGAWRERNNLTAADTLANVGTLPAGSWTLRAGANFMDIHVLFYTAGENCVLQPWGKLKTGHLVPIGKPLTFTARAETSAAGGPFISEVRTIDLKIYSYVFLQVVTPAAHRIDLRAAEDIDQ